MTAMKVGRPLKGKSLRKRREVGVCDEDWATLKRVAAESQSGKSINDWLARIAATYRYLDGEGD
jgi:hypothetical protein